MRTARVELEGALAGGSRIRRPDRAPDSPAVPVELRGAPQSLTVDAAADYLDLGSIGWNDR